MLNDSYIEHKIRDQAAYKSQEWVLKVTNTETSEIRLGSDVVWLRGSDAVLGSLRQLSAKTTINIKGEYRVKNQPFVVD